MYEVVPVLRYVSGHGCRGPVLYLDSEPVRKIDLILIANFRSIPVFWQQMHRKIPEKRRFLSDLGETRGIEISPEIGGDVTASAVITCSVETGVVEPAALPNRVYFPADEFTSGCERAVETVSSFLDSSPNIQIHSVPGKRFRIADLSYCGSPSLP